MENFELKKLFADKVHLSGSHLQIEQAEAI
jgi:hypothetical protein